MTARPAAQVLVCFGSQDQPDAVGAVAQQDLVCLPLAPEAPAEDFAILLEAAREEGKALGLAAARAEHAAARAQERLLLEARLGAERANWTQQEGERLSAQLTAALRDVEAAIAESAARALRGFLMDRLRREAVAQLACEVRALFTGEARPVIAISGAADLLAMLRESLASFGDAIEYAANLSPDVKGVVDQTIIETRMEAWIERVAALSE